MQEPSSRRRERLKRIHGECRLHFILIEKSLLEPTRVEKERHEKKKQQHQLAHSGVLWIILNGRGKLLISIDGELVM